MTSDYSEAFACGVEAWSGFWGDPLFSGTLMVVTYAVAALMALRAVRGPRGRQGLRGVERVVWALAAVLLVFQVANTPLDLHGLAWASGRCLAHIQGWYAARHAYQRELLILVALTVCALMAICILVRNKRWQHRVCVAQHVHQPGLSLGVGLVIADHCGQAHQRAVGAPGPNAIDHQPVLGGEIPGDLAPFLIEPVVDHHPGLTLLDDRAVDLERCL